jgi:HSP20 family protein
MTEEMDRMFGEFGMNRGEQWASGGWAPAIEVSERDGKYLVRADLPGIKPDDVKLEVTDDAVVLQGERKSEHEDTRGGVHVSERSYGSFYRTIPLPEGAKVDEARAKFENGVLEVEVPVAEQRSKRRQIPIEGGSKGQGQSGSTERAA